MISHAFINFSAECSASSKLYEFLSLKIASESELLELCMDAKTDQPVPNLLFGAVHYLLLQGSDHELGNFYPSITSFPDNPESAFPAFKNFCQKHQKKISQLLKSKRVQTNEVRRCAYLYPVFCHIFRSCKKPLAMVEIGTSAGLQLLWDTYSYDYGDGAIYGNPDSSVRLTSQCLSEKPFLFRESPLVGTRIGIDVHINDLTVNDNLLWLTALIWPEHEERRRLLNLTAGNLAHANLNLLEGDGVQLLPEITNSIPKSQTLVIFHTHVANQFSFQTKQMLLDQIKQINKQRNYSMFIIICGIRCFIWMRFQRMKYLHT